MKSQCTAITKEGKRCEALPMWLGAAFCPLHNCMAAGISFKKRSKEEIERRRLYESLSIIRQHLLTSASNNRSKIQMLKSGLDVGHSEQTLKKYLEAFELGVSIFDELRRELRPTSDSPPTTHPTTGTERGLNHPPSSQDAPQRILMVKATQDSPKSSWGRLGRK